MEVQFPHLTNGIAKATPTRRQRTRAMRNLLFTAGVCGTLALSVSFAFASTMNQEMIAEQESFQVEMCYQLKKEINEFMWDYYTGLGVTQAMKYSEILEKLTNSYANYCKR